VRYYLKARNGVWYIRWTDDAGRPQGKSTGSRDRGIAEQRLAAHELKHAQPRDLRLSEVTLDAVLVRYWEHHGRTRFAAGIIRLVIKRVATLLPCLPLEQLTMAKQERLIEGLTPGTARRYLGVIRAALEWAAARQEIERAPRIKRVEVEDGPGALPYSLEELRQLLAAARAEHERRLLILMLATGARPQAVLQLTWDRIRDGVADFHVPGRRKTKKRRARAPLSSSVSSWLEARRGLGPVVQWNGRAMKKHRMTFQRVAARAGVAGTAYGVRKALATWLRQQNVPEWEVGALLGHRVSSATTERYAHHRPDYMAATVAAVEALLAAVKPLWLDTSKTVEVAPAGPSFRIRMVSNGLVGSREWDRTTDHLHVKEVELGEFQLLEAINDD
jgi:integrase